LNSSFSVLFEYGAKCNFENINVFKACWVCTKDSNNTEKEEFKKIKQKILTSFSTTYINNLIIWFILKSHPQFGIAISKELTLLTKTEGFNKKNIYVTSIYLF
jgi:hypothetical protein